tara:strand:+ start:978 stop:1094 length:117 start_codon:yes stop_codon:yes gene_type:complete
MSIENSIILSRINKVQKNFKCIILVHFKSLEKQSYKSQ